MPSPDPSDFDDDHPRRGPRRAAGRRPTWDASTYGGFDDHRLPSAPPPGGGGFTRGTHAYGDGFSSQPLFADDGYPSRHRGEPSPDERYRASEADGDPYPYPEDGHRYQEEAYHRPDDGFGPDDPYHHQDDPYRYPAEASVPEGYPSGRRTDDGGAPGRGRAGRDAPGRDPGGRDVGGRDARSLDARSRDAGGRDARGKNAKGKGAGGDSGGRGGRSRRPQPGERPEPGERVEPGERPASPPSPSPTGRAGRNLPAAIGVGVLLGGIVVSSLFLWRPAFFGVIAVAVGVGVWELVRAVRGGGVNPPLVPLVAGGALMTGLAWWGHAEALTFGLIVTVLAVMVWRLADRDGDYGRDVSAATFIAVYVPFLAGFAALLATPADGDLRVLVTLAGVVLSDTGGYVAGVLFGRHPMAPSVSPKKSWEGLAGSLIATAIGGAIMFFLLFDVAAWRGAVFGVAVSAASVLGDLGESLIKRDLGVKDMSELLPGHGGLMDRLDSVVFAAPAAYALFAVLAPPL
jgi:phosphatidate cytidylyltransferase